MCRFFSAVQKRIVSVIHPRLQRPVFAIPLANFKPKRSCGVSARSSKEDVRSVSRARFNRLQLHFSPVLNFSQKGMAPARSSASVTPPFWFWMPGLKPSFSAPSGDTLILFLRKSGKALYTALSK